MTDHRLPLRAAWTLAVFAWAIGSTPAVGSESSPGGSKCDATLRVGNNGPTKVIVRTVPGSRPAVVNRLQQQRYPVVSQSDLIDAVSTVVDAAGLAGLDDDPAVVSISTDAAVFADSSPKLTSGPVTLLATLALSSGGPTGRGVGVAVIDSGLVNNADFNHIRFFDFTGGGIHPYDDFGHGTHVTGLIGSAGTLSRTPNGPLYQGVAPEANIISLKVLDANGTGATSTVIAAIEFAVTNRQSLGIDVINLSLGHPILEPAATDPLVQAVEAAVRSGIVVVVSAGNVGRSLVTGLPGYAGILSPGNAPSAITVGALDTNNSVTPIDDAVPSYSSRGPTFYDGLAKPDLVAPGQDLISDAAPGSTLFTQFPDRQVTTRPGGPSQYFRLSGTSMSAAVTSGTVALLLQVARDADQTLTPNLVKAILEYTALPLPQYDALTQGRGAVDPAGAIRLLQAIDPSAPIGSWWIASPVQPVTILGGVAQTWSQTVVWGNTVVSGNILGIHEPAWDAAGWGDPLVWGTADDFDGTVVWGNFENDVDGTVVWGNCVVWGNTVVWGNIVDADFVTLP